MPSSQPQAVTEIAYVPLKAGIQIDDDSTPEGEALAAAFKIISTQEGYCESYYARQLEATDVLMWFINWTSHDAHVRFTHAPIYTNFLSKMNKLLASAPPTFHHFFPSPFPPEVLSSAPCTEVATFYGTSATFLSNVQRFSKVLEDAVPEGFKGVALGPVLEQIAKPGNGEEGSAVVLCIGWASKEHHLKFRDENPVFKENVWLLREGNSGAEVVHVALKNVVT